MSRRPSRWAVLARIGLVAGVVYVLLPDKVASVLVNREIPAEVTMSRAATVYVLQPGMWSTFQVPVSQTQVKIVSNAGVAASSYATDDLPCEYTIQAEILGASDTILRTQELTLRANILTYRDAKTGEPCPAQAYLGEPLMPLSSRTTVVNLEDLDDLPLRVRMRQGSSDPRVHDIAVRVYVQERPPQYKLRYLWQRLPEAKKMRLARANVHALELLSDYEKQNLLENRSVALAPLGLKERDYWERKLYSLRDKQGIDFAGFILPRGLYVGPDMLGSIPVPEGVTCLRLELQAVDAQNPGAAVGVTIHDREALEPRAIDIDLDGPKEVELLECSGGLVEVEASAGVVARAFYGDGGQTLEITPEAERLPSYQLLPDAPVRFAVVARDQSSGALRVDVRRLIEPQQASSLRPAIIRYELRDAGGGLMHAGLALHNEPPSRHDRVRGAFKGAQVTEPSRHYFRTPPGCATLLLYSLSPGVCVSASTRPDGLPRTVRVPEEYLAYERGQDDERNWFPVRPENHAECLARQREVFVRLQPRPPGFSSLLRQGYQASSCTPENVGETYKLMTTATVASLRSRPASSVYFNRLMPGETSAMVVGHAPASPWAEPRLVCLKGSSHTARVTLRVDGRIHAHWTTASASNEWTLPPLAAGSHELRADADEPCEIYINHCEPVVGVAHVEQTVSTIGPEPLRFRIEKKTTGTELLSFRLHQPAGQPEAHVARVTATGPPRRMGLPTESWTFAETVYHVRPSEKVSGRLLGTDPARLAGGELFLLTLGADVEPGWNEIVVSLEEGPPCFLQATHIVPGIKDSKGFFAGGSVVAPEAETTLPADE